MLDGIQGEYLEELLRSGKVKDVYAAGEDELEFVFSNRISVFDKIIPSEVPYKGETLCKTSAYWFGVLDKLGIQTHFIKLTPPNRMQVKRVNVVPDYLQLGSNSKNYLIPLELVTRYFVYGSLWDRVRNGTVKPEQLGFAPGHEVKLAEPLPDPFFEVTTKLEKVDRNLSIEEAQKISAMSNDEYEQMKELCFRIDDQINSRVNRRGLIHVDGKKEFAFDGERALMVVDTFGTPDEDRFWDSSEFNNGKYVERSKEFVRQFYRDSGYHSKLMSAREYGDAEPPIPALPQDTISQVSQIYIKLSEDITGESFR